MRLVGLTVENFRCYRTPVSVRFGNLTALVGRNDVGKSTLMDALAIFFDAVSPDKDDACKAGDPKEMRITCEFDEVPAMLIVDTTFPTNMADEYLLSADGTLVIQKTYNGSLLSPKVTSVEALATHPTANGYSDLLSLKKAELLKRAADLGIDLTGVDKSKNAPIRAAIWASCPDLQCAQSLVPLNSEGGKQVWDELVAYLPAFALFKSDRASTDQDAEAQDPLKAAIREALQSVEPRLKEIRDFVEGEVAKIAKATVEKLREMDASVAETLNPVVSTKKWETLFSTSITGDENIPLNKRGSGVKRLVLLNFFRAKAEKAFTDKNAGSVIYAIEEPETSQHPRNQRLLLNALRELADGDGKQVVLTTHTPMLARYLDDADLRLIEKAENGTRSIKEGELATSEEIARSLGVLADHNVKVFVGVEGPHDISFLKGISKILVDAGQDVPNLEQMELEGELIFVPLGGSNLALWASRLAPFVRPEFYLCDRDVQPPAQPKYSEFMAAINARNNCIAVATQKRELESYLHHEAISEAYAQNQIALIFDGQFADFDDVPSLVAQAVHAINGGGAWATLDPDKQRKKESAVKRQLNNTAVARMTVDRLAQTDPDDEIRGWLAAIGQMVVTGNT